MVIKSQVVINQLLTAVWNYFIQEQNWEMWWGAKLKSVSPRWEWGATLMWGQGQSTVGNFIKQGLVELPSDFVLNTFKFKSITPKSTLVELEMMPSGGSFFRDGGRSQQAENNISLNKLKMEIEAIESSNLSDLSLLKTLF